MRIGIDIGNVIIGGGGDDTQFFGDDYLNTPFVEGAHSIHPLTYKHEVHLISKCGVSTEYRTMDYLRLKNFLHVLLPAQRVHFVRKRELKAPMAQALQLDIFIDDREDVLVHMEGIVAHRILFTSWEQTIKELEEIFATAEG